MYRLDIFSNLKHPILNAQSFLPESTSVIVFPIRVNGLPVLSAAVQKKLGVILSSSFSHTHKWHTATLVVYALKILCIQNSAGHFLSPPVFLSVLLQPTIISCSRLLTSGWSVCFRLCLSSVYSLKIF